MTVSTLFVLWVYFLAFQNPEDAASRHGCEMQVAKRLEQEGSSLAKARFSPNEQG